jgi:hypothetical protein
VRTAEPRRFTQVTFILLILSICANVTQAIIFEYIRASSKASGMRALHYCETHRDAISVVAQKHFSLEDMERMRSWRIVVNQGSDGQYSSSSLGTSITCTETYTAKENEYPGGIVLPKPCESSGSSKK